MAEEIGDSTVVASRTLVAAIEGEYKRYKTLGDGACAQLNEDELNAQAGAESNSIAMVCWHVSGNLASRFTDFLISDGEKVWRVREEEFAERSVTRAEFDAKWEAGWKALLDTIASLTDADMDRMVTIRRVPLSVRDALLRSLAHASYHVGQIVYIAKALKGPGWRYLTIPPGKSDEYNKDPKYEKPADLAAHVKR